MLGCFRLERARLRRIDAEKPPDVLSEQFHLHNIYAKLNVVNRAQAATTASKLGLV
jgi:hypothetical protein